MPRPRTPTPCTAGACRTCPRQRGSQSTASPMRSAPGRSCWPCTARVWFEVGFAAWLLPGRGDCRAVFEGPPVWATADVGATAANQSAGLGGSPTRTAALGLWWWEGAVGARRVSVNQGGPVTELNLQHWQEHCRTIQQSGSQFQLQLISALALQETLRSFCEGWPCVHERSACPRHAQAPISI